MEVVFYPHQHSGTEKSPFTTPAHATQVLEVFAGDAVINSNLTFSKVLNFGKGKMNLFFFFFRFRQYQVQNYPNHGSQSDSAQ